MTTTARSLGAHALLLALTLLPSLARAEDKPLATADTNMKATAEIYECKRKEGVLTIKVRFKATSDTYIGLSSSLVYVLDVAAGKKYEVLRDSEKRPLATAEHVRVYPKAGETTKAWWKFPAPPAKTKKVTFSLPNCEPFEDVPITDAP